MIVEIFQDSPAADAAFALRLARLNRQVFEFSLDDAHGGNDENLRQFIGKFAQNCGVFAGFVNRDFDFRFEALADCLVFAELFKLFVDPVADCENAVDFRGGRLVGVLRAVGRPILQVD